MNSPEERHDKLIRATDLDALSCRNSINEKNYLQPKDEFINDLINSYQTYLQYSQGYSSLSSSRTLKAQFLSKKLPIINRGTYMRTKIITDFIQKYIDYFGGVCQILSLGSGSDTRAFHLLSTNPMTKYHEIDFPESTRIKKLGILNNPRLMKLLSIDPLDIPSVKSKESFNDLDPNLHTNRYHLHGLDLRGLNSITQIKGLDTNLPTLIISECVLCYLSPEEYRSTIEICTNFGNENLTSFLIYEPMSLKDSFGSTMNQNLMGRGLNLQTFDEYPDLESRLRFFKDMCKLSNIRMTDISNVAGYNKNSPAWIDDIELRRINSLEMIDEIEEIKLLLEHYCLVYGEFRNSPNAPTFSGVDDFNWLLKHDH
ncbi:PPM1 [Candida pseudojiufengensis]|uniref:PPM1 n=1 Tax=Candida pseudojiufengensis TaxID=497109 RepID=UPI00222569B0|nr:PPM1 [Candida pseudojiufengensis]KAI5962591.1 PPM1 [Candida pseudojiufengensis]